MERARIDLCGELRVELGEQLDEELPRGQIRVLLAYLVLERKRPVSRDQLAGALWGERPPARWDVALSSLLSRLRHRLGARAEIAGRGELRLRLPGETRVDFELAERAAALAEESLAADDPRASRAAAAEALAVAEQGFLPGHRGPWVDQRQRALEEIGIRGLESTAAACAQLGGNALAEGEQAATALLERDPYRETAYRHLIAIQEGRGDVAAALRTFERLRTLLREELGAAPAPDLLATHRRLLGTGAATADPADSPIPRTSSSASR